MLIQLWLKYIHLSTCFIFPEDFKIADTEEASFKDIE